MAASAQLLDPSRIVRHAVAREARPRNTLKRLSIAQNVFQMLKTSFNSPRRLSIAQNVFQFPQTFWNSPKPLSIAHGARRVKVVMAGALMPCKHWSSIYCREGVYDEDDVFAFEHPQETRSSIASFRGVPAANRVILTAHSKTAAHPVGMLLVEVCPNAGGSNTSRLGCHATIHSLYVRPEARGSGMGNALMQRAVTFCAAVAARKCEQDASVSMRLTWRLADGSCRRHPATLRLLLRHGWRVVLNAEKELSMPVLKRMEDADTDMNHVDVSVTGPTFPLDLPILRADCVCGMANFVAPDAMPAAPSTPGMLRLYESSFKINRQLILGKMPLLPLGTVFPAPNKGLLPFCAPLQACVDLEEYLSTPEHHSFSDAHGHLIHHLHVGDARLPGYEKYDAVNKLHVANAQSLRTSVANSEAKIEAAIYSLPGLALILQTGLRKIGLKIGNAPRALLQYVRHIHFLLLDGTSQVDFSWHEDTYDVDVSNKEVRDRYISIIVQLSATFTTAVQILNFPYHEYPGLGAGVIFHSRALHRSVSRVSIPNGHAVWKVAVFLDPGGRFPAKTNRSDSSYVHTACAD